MDGGQILVINGRCTEIKSGTFNNEKYHNVEFSWMGGSKKVYVKTAIDLEQWREDEWYNLQFEIKPGKDSTLKAGALLRSQVAPQAGQPPIARTVAKAA